MRALVLLLLASTGCAKILGIEDIVPSDNPGNDGGTDSGTDGDTDDVIIRGQVLAYPDGSPLNGVGVDLRRDADGASAVTVTTIANGAYRIIVPPSEVPFDGFLTLQDEGSGRNILFGGWHWGDLFAFTADIDLVAFTADDVASMYTAGDVTSGAGEYLARVEVVDSSFAPVEGALVDVTTSAAELVRYTNATQHTPVPASTAIATTTNTFDGNAYAYVYKLDATVFQTFRASFEGRSALVGPIVNSGPGTVTQVVIQLPD